MRKKLFTFLLALVTSVGMSWAVPTEFANCYDCWRSPNYPNISGQCHLFNFGNPGVGNGNPSGPWKLEFVEYYNSSSTEYDDIVSSYAANQYGKSPEQMEVYRLYQWQNGAYQPVAYGVLYAYANENNAVEHAAFFEANGYWGCYFTDNTHSSGDDFNITFDEDAATGFADLHGGSTPATGLQVVEVTSELYAGWNSNSNPFTVDALPGFQAVTFDEAKEWTEVPTSGTAVLVYRTNGDNARVIQFFDGTITGDYDVETSFNQMYENITLFGNRIFYTAGGGSTPTPTPNPHGECGAQGDNLLWEFNPSTGTLTITGSGAMADWHDDTQRPWYSYYGQITSVVLPEGLTTIGEKAFKACDIVSINTNNVLPSTLTTIKQEGFCGIDVTNITIPASVVSIEQDAFYLSKTITDVYCYADPNNLTWVDYYCDDFNKSPAKSTVCHVKNCYLDVYNTNWNTGTTGSSSPDINVTFVGDLPGECGGSSDPQDPQPSVGDYTISLDIAENADKVTLSAASADAGETITVTPAAGYQITSFTASYDSNYKVWIREAIYGDVKANEPDITTLPKEYTLHPELGNGTSATYQSFSNGGGAVEYLGTNAAGTEMYIRVNGVTTENASIAYQYQRQECMGSGSYDPVLDEWTFEEVCNDVTDNANILIACEQSGIVSTAEATENDGVWSFTMPAGNVTITATVEAIPEPVVTNYAVSLDIAENADKVTLRAASAVEGATVTLTPAEGYQITSFTATSGSGNGAVRFTSDPNESVDDAEPQYVTLPHEFTADVIPGKYGASFVEIEGGEGQIEYVGMNSAGDQLTFRVNGAFSGTAFVQYSHDELECEELEPGEDPICIGVTAISTVRVICAAEGGGSEVPSVKDDVTGAYSFTMPAGNVTITATVEAIPAPTAAVIGDPNNASEVETFLTTYDGQTIDELIIDRPVLNNMYNTLCLPFDMNAAQIAASSLNGVEIREFTGASVDGTTLNLSVGDPVNAVVAGRPYFVKFSAASQLDDLHFEGVTINNALLDNMAVTFDGVTFKGTFTPFVMPNGLNFQGGYLFLGQNNQLYWPNTNNPLKPFRAYFYVDVEASTPGNAPKYRGMPARIVEGKNVATGVENAQSANQSTKVIVNGQLIIIKNDVRYNAQGQIVK